MSADAGPCPAGRRLASAAPYTPYRTSTPSAQKSWRPRKDAQAFACAGKPTRGAPLAARGALAAIGCDGNPLRVGPKPSREAYRLPQMRTDFFGLLIVQRGPMCLERAHNIVVPSTSLRSVSAGL
jgi:hypothetical protein